MKARLIAVVVAGLGLAAPALAQNLTLYGRLNVDLEVVNGKQNISKVLPKLGK